MMMHYWKFNALLMNFIFYVSGPSLVLYTICFPGRISGGVCISAYLLTSPGIRAGPHFHAPCDEHFPGPSPGVTPRLIITRYLDIYCPLQLPRSTDRSLGVKHVQTMRCMIRGLLVTDTWHTSVLVQPASSSWRTQSVGQSCKRHPSPFSSPIE